MTLLPAKNRATSEPSLSRTPDNARRRSRLAVAVRFATAAALISSLPRALAADISWRLDASGNWGTATSWSTGVLPKAIDNVTISRPAGDYLISITVPGALANNLTADERLAISGSGTLGLAGVAQINNLFTLGGGTITGGQLSLGPSGALAFGTTATNLQDVRIDAPLSLTTTNARVKLSGQTTVNGRITLSGTGSTLTFFGSTVSNEILLAGTNSDAVTVIGMSPTLANSVLTSGALVHGVGAFAGMFDNYGTISADVPGRTLAVGSINNYGVLEARNGSNLLLTGTLTNSGTFHAEPGSGITFSGFLSNTGKTFTFDSSIGSVLMQNATVTGGVVNVPNYDYVAFSLKNRFAGVQINGPLNLTSDNTAFTFSDGTVASDNITLSGANTSLTLIGAPLTTSVQFAASTDTASVIVQSDPTTTTLTTATGVIHGGNGTVTISSPSSVHLGLISADKPNQMLSVGGGGTLINRGTLEATVFSTLRLTGLLSNETGTIRSNNGGTVYFEGATVTAGPGTPTVDMASGKWTASYTIFDGGTYAVGPTTFAIEEYSAFDHAVVNGTITVAPSTSLGLQNGTVVHGNVQLSGASSYVTLSSGATADLISATGASTSVRVASDITITGTINLLGTGSGIYRATTSTANPVITVAPSGVIHGGVVPAYFGDIPITGSSGSFSIVNNGLISSDWGSRALSVSSNISVTNNGTLFATNGTTLTIPWLTNFSAGIPATLTGGTYRVDLGSTLRFGGKFIGTLAADLQLDGPNSTLGSGSNQAGQTDALLYFSAIAPTGKLSLTGGRKLTLSNGLSVDGLLTLGANSSVILGSAATLNVTRGGKLAGAGAVTGAVTLAGLLDPSASDASQTALFTVGSLIAQPTAAIHLDIAGVAADSHDALSILGSAAVAGTVMLDFSSAYVPVTGDTMTLMSASALSLDPSTVFRPLNVRSDWQFNVSVIANTLTITALTDAIALPALPGDYNADGLVDAADYTLWADTFGATGFYLPADGNRDGLVDAADYTIWADHFGSSSPAALQASVPETQTLLPLLAAGILLRRRRR